MDLDQTIKSIKQSLKDAKCNWCNGDITLYGVSEVKETKIKGVIKCLKCNRFNPATFNASG